jgi:hypothetical protein
MTTLKIKVTKEILVFSKYCGIEEPGYIPPPHSKSCAIALAVRDILPEASVFAEYIVPFDFGGDFSARFKMGTIELPKEAIYFIKRFDLLTPEERMEMSEFEFEVEIPDDVIEQINIEELRPLLENHSTLQLIKS